MLSFFGANLMMQNYPDRPLCQQALQIGERAATNQTFLTRTEERDRMSWLQRLLRVFVRTGDITQFVVCAWILLLLLPTVLSWKLRLADVKKSAVHSGSLEARGMSLTCVLTLCS